MRTPALEAWRRELAARMRTKHDFDALWRAACEEMGALDATTRQAAESRMRAAEHIVREAAKQQQGAA